MSPLVPTSGKTRSWLKWLFLCLWIIGAVCLVRSPRFASYWRDFQSTKETLHSHGLWGAVSFTGAIALFFSLGFPRLILYGLAGGAYGTCLGVLISQIGATLGAYSNFLVVRLLGPSAGRLDGSPPRKWQGMLERRAFWSVFLARQMPISGLVINSLLALSPIRHGPFLAGTFLGFLPEGMIAVLIGSGIGKARIQEGLLQLGLGGLIALLAWGLYRRRLKTRQ